MTNQQIYEKLVSTEDIKYCTRSSYDFKKEDDGNTLCTRKSNHRPQKTNMTSFGQRSFNWLGLKSWVQISNQLESIAYPASFKSQVKKVNFDNGP